jgi:predicted nucleic acid-binding protein
MVFIDTNVFVYAHDESDLVKAQQARQLLLEQISIKQAVISTQVIQEFCSATLKKARQPLRPEDVRKVIRELLAPLVGQQPDPAFYLRTLATYERYSLSFYDAAIIQAANDMGCTVLYSEDLQAGATYGKVKVVNPFTKV